MDKWNRLNYLPNLPMGKGAKIALFGKATIDYGQWNPLRQAE